MLEGWQGGHCLLEIFLAVSQICQYTSEPENAITFRPSLALIDSFQLE